MVGGDFSFCQEGWRVNKSYAWKPKAEISEVVIDVRLIGPCNRLGRWSYLAAVEFSV